MSSVEPAGLTQSSPVGPAQTWASQVMDQNLDFKLLTECVIGRSSSRPCDPELWTKLARKTDGWILCVCVIQLCCFYFEKQNDVCMDAHACVSHVDCQELPLTRSEMKLGAQCVLQSVSELLSARVDEGVCGTLEKEPWRRLHCAVRRWWRTSLDTGRLR